MKKQLPLLAALLFGTANAQVSGDIATFKKATGAGDVKTYNTPVPNSLASYNGSNGFVLLPQATFSLAAHTHTFASLTSKPTTISGYGITDFVSLGDAEWAQLVHTHLSAQITDASIGGNGVADAGLLAKFGATGGLRGSSSGVGVAAILGLATGTCDGVNGSGDSGTGVVGTSNSYIGVQGNSTSGIGGSFASFGTTEPAFRAKVFDATNVAPIAHFWADDNLGVVVLNDGGLSWTSATGAATTRTGLSLGSLALLSAITLTGDVTGSGSGSFAATIAADAVTNAKLAEMVDTQIIGRARGAGTGNPTYLTADETSDILDQASDPFLRTSVGGGGAPTDATYITQTAHAGLSAEQALGLLGTGIVKNTTTTGVLSIAVAGDFPTLNQSTTGSAATLTTPRTINGTSFDGSTNITVTAAAGTLTGTTLNSSVVTSSLTSVGTITTGVWTGTDVAVADGGTGASTAKQARSNLGLRPVTITAITGGSQATTVVTLADVTGSTITFPDTGWYEFEYFTIHSAGATTTGAFYAVNVGTAVLDFVTYCVNYDVVNTDRDTYCINAVNSGVAASSSRGTTAVNRNRLQGTVHVTTAGTILLRFATEVNASAITITDLTGWYRNL